MIETVNQIKTIAPPEADEWFSFAPISSGQMKRSMTLCSLRLCGEQQIIQLSDLCLPCEMLALWGRMTVSGRSIFHRGELERAKRAGERLLQKTITELLAVTS